MVVHSARRWRRLDDPGRTRRFLNSQRLKGIHLAIKSGMLAAETAYEAMTRDDFSLEVLATFQDRVENSWIKEELWPVRNFHQGLRGRFSRWNVQCRDQQVTGGRGLRAHYGNHAGHERLKPYLGNYQPTAAPRPHHRRRRGRRQADVRQADRCVLPGTEHEEDQPAHLVIDDTTSATSAGDGSTATRARTSVPANVYEMVEAADTPRGRQIHLNASNCVHCKTCDIMDPYQIITWVPPEGGGGPNYEGM